MNEQDINNLIEQKINSYMDQKQYDVSKIPNHLHNGTDTNKINAVDINQNVKYSGLLTSEETEDFVITSIFPNIGRIVFQGFAANNKSVPATKRALINGEVQLGNCFQFNGTGSNISLIEVSIPITIISSTSSIYIDSTDLTKSQVAAANEQGLIAYATDELGNVVAALQVDSYTNNAIKFSSTLATDWKLQGVLTFI